MTLLTTQTCRRGAGPQPAAGGVDAGPAASEPSRPRSAARTENTMSSEPRVIVCRGNGYARRAITYCPTCKQRRRFAVSDELWYGRRQTCCGCGDTWTDGQRNPRPFCRGWRVTAIARARQEYADAGPLDKSAYRQWLAEEVGWAS